VRNCHVCSRTKTPRFHHGKEKALKVPDGPDTLWSIDFVVSLPESVDYNGTSFTNILTATNRFTKRKHFIPIKTITAVDLANALLQVIKLHGLPTELVSDRGT
jgi:hypothetical protein